MSFLEKVTTSLSRLFERNTKLRDYDMPGSIPGRRPLLEKLGITQSLLDNTLDWAIEFAKYGKIPDYIPALQTSNPDKHAIAVHGLNKGDYLVSSKNGGEDVVFSMQSVAKPFLYLYALHKGLDHIAISDLEATGKHFNNDLVLDPESGKLLPTHPLNNAGGISSADIIGDDWDGFLEFMRTITNNNELGILDDIYESEKNNWANNLAITARMVVGGRFGKELDGSPMEKGMKALDNYTKACSLGVTVKDLAYAGAVLANYGIDINTGKQLVEAKYTIRTVGAMTTFGLYEESGKFAMMSSGNTANSVKSGVGGGILGVLPGQGSYASYSPATNLAGNSVVGVNAMIPLNRYLAGSHETQLPAEDSALDLVRFHEEQSLLVHQDALEYMRDGESIDHFRLDLSTALKRRGETSKDHGLLQGLVDKLS